MELISVVVVTYNSGKTVLETLESIQRQTYPDLELIITDDHSADNTVEIVRDWLKIHHKRFVEARLLKAKKNNGVTKNCNIGMNQAHGKYIQLIAGDDILLECAIEKKYQFAEKYSLNLVCSKVEVFGNNMHNVASMERLCERCYDIMKGKWDKQYKNILKFNFVIGPMCGFYLMKYFKQVRGFDIRYPMLEDWPFIFHYIVEGNKIKLLDETLTQYRISDQSLSMKKDILFDKSVRNFVCYEVVKELIKCKRFKEAKDRIKEFF